MSNSIERIRSCFKTDPSTLRQKGQGRTVLGAENFIKRINEEPVTEAVLAEMQHSQDLDRSRTVLAGNTAREQNMRKKLYSEGKEKIFTQIMFEAFVESLYLDDDAKQANAEELFGLVEGFIAGNGGYAMLENAAPNSEWLQEVQSVCEATANEVADRKSKEGAIKAQKIDFGINQKEKDKLDKDISELNIDSLSKLVKEKVITVIQDEKKRSQDKKDFEEDVQSGIEEAVKESVRFNSANKVPMSTLYESIMTSNYKEMVLESVVSFNNGASGPNQTKTIAAVEKDFSEEELEYSHPQKSVINSAYEDDSFDDASIGTTEGKECECHKIDTPSVELESVMAESITNYTLLETFYTTGLKDFDRSEIRNMTIAMTRSKRSKK